MSWLVRWWRQSDHYEQLSSHLKARGMAALTRSTIAMIAGVLALIAVGTIWAPTGPQGSLQVGLAVTAGLGAMIGMLLWALRWPSRTQAIAFVVLCNASIALAALAQSHPLAAILTCTTFATMATHVALFHPAPLMAYNFAIAALISAFEAVRVAHAYNVAAAACAFMLVLILNLAVPFGIQTVVHVLGVDAVRAERDQLTGLLNRAAFYRRAKRLLRHSTVLSAHVVVTVIDLDRFKQLNDRYGHGTGDDALVAVAAALRQNTADSAVIGRIGGEEFVIADLWHPDELARRAQLLCEAIAALPFKLTASVGTAGTFASARRVTNGELLVELISAADEAMYVAKRGGGNRARHYQPQPGTDGSAPARSAKAVYFRDELSA